MVIAIIILLAALLLPALKQSRNTARGLVCRSNERQVGLACFTWGQDNRDVVMNDRPFFCSSSYPYGYFLLVDRYLDGDWPEVATTVPYINWRAYKKSGTKVLFCPSFVASPYQSPAYPLNTDGQGFNCTADITYQYGMNGYFSNGGTGVCPAISWWRPPLPAKDFKMPDATLWLADQEGWLEVLALPYPALRHANATNVLFVDGHVQPLTQSQFTPDYTAYPWYFTTGY